VPKNIVHETDARYDEPHIDHSDHMTLIGALCRYIWDTQWVAPQNGRFLYKQMTREGTAPSFPFVADFFGLTYRGDLSNTIDYHVFYYGAFEKPILFFMRDTMKAIRLDGGVFLDIGANVGQHSLFMSQYAKQVHAFEPYDMVRKQLEQRVCINQLKNVEIHPVGLSNENRRLPFYAPSGRNLGIGSFDAGSVAKGNQYCGELQVVIGDDYLQHRGIKNVDLIKIDVEGFEMNVIQGLQKTILEQQPILLIELTYGHTLSFQSDRHLFDAFPPDYVFFNFNVRKKNGRKARRRESKARRTGQYALVPYHFGTSDSQDDVIACPQRKLPMLPRHSDFM
jgi:FkbM family methyltransferase